MPLGLFRDFRNRIPAESCEPWRPWMSFPRGTQVLSSAAESVAAHANDFFGFRSVPISYQGQKLELTTGMRHDTGTSFVRLRCLLCRARKRTMQAS
eukprot:874159-Pyramimonas_sp.AAC.1